MKVVPDARRNTREYEAASNMETKAKVLVVDDDPGILDAYPGILAQLPSTPEVHTANSGSRALACLNDEDYRLLICDLIMPRMDGLQVLSVARKKYPQLRTVALTAGDDEQLRSRAYGLGVDLFWHKPTESHDVQPFLACVEALLSQDTDSGFRGVQSKSLVDIIQMECMSQNSVVLRICNTPLIARIWILEGEVVDAEIADLRGEPAFHRILSWRSGSFETMPAEPKRPRTIFKSCSSLLLESASVLDEALSNAPKENGTGNSPLNRLTEVEGIEFLVSRRGGDPTKQSSRGIENPDGIANWAGKHFKGFQELGEKLQAGTIEQLEGIGPHRKLTVTTHEQIEFCIGWKAALNSEQIRDLTKKVYALWGS